MLVLLTRMHPSFTKRTSCLWFTQLISIIINFVSYGNKIYVCLMKLKTASHISIKFLPGKQKPFMNGDISGLQENVTTDNILIIVIA